MNRAVPPQTLDAALQGLDGPSLKTPIYGERTLCQLNTCARDKGPLIHTIPVTAVAALAPDTDLDGKLVVGRHPGIRLSGTVTAGPQFSVTPGQEERKVARGGKTTGYPGMEVHREGPVPSQTITATLSPGAGLAFKPEAMMPGR
ncbi:hypothetical protein [Streptomyces sp. MH13]|uniref:hypothetical protein n=1 Tax=Streptomyces sp. MH13 TaxID=3417651 RepID=UPI003CEE4BB1